MKITINVAKEDDSIAGLEDIVDTIEQTLRDEGYLPKIIEMTNCFDIVIEVEETEDED